LSLIFPVDQLRRTRQDHRVDDLSAAVARDFGAKLRQAREGAGLTQEALADLSGISRTAISPLERGQHMPRLDTLIKLAGALGTEPCELIADYRWHPPTQGPALGRFQRAADS
jgi:transcriptional regulator with XRE-family HTH domain